MDWRDVGNGHKISVLRLTSTPIKASGSQQNAQPQCPQKTYHLRLNLHPRICICKEGKNNNSSNGHDANKCALQSEKSSCCQHCGQQSYSIGNLSYVIQEYSDTDVDNDSNGSGEVLSTIFPDSQVQTSNVCDTNCWHTSISKDLRDHLVHKIVQAIFPEPDPEAVFDKRMYDLVACAKKIESDAFERASSRPEYYQFLAEKVFEVQKEQQKRRKKRQQIQMGQSKGTTSAEATTSQQSSSGSKSQNVKMEQQMPMLSQQQHGTKSGIAKSNERDDCKIMKEKFAVFNQTQLVNALLPTWDQMQKANGSKIFRQPVPVSDQIPNYFDIVKKPMDLSTIHAKLTTRQYSTPREYVDDVWLMFDNAWLYNQPNTLVYRNCTYLSELFKKIIDSPMQSFGYCCGQKYMNPQMLVCSNKQCIIPIHTKYHSHLYIVNGEADEFILCDKCFTAGGEVVTLNDMHMKPIETSKFTGMKNGHWKLKQMVDCRDCGRSQHQTCALHNDTILPGGFVCASCLQKKGERRKENKFSAKRLSTTKLSDYIETRVNDFLKKQKAITGKVHIRVVSSSDKMVEIHGHVDGGFPYRSKAIFAFQEINGIDLWFFGMYVQEYDSKCSQPNTRRVYIAYLDSVNFFEPKVHRTDVYHEILLGYLDYVKQLGYVMAHIWACPPTEGEEYIFNCHPPDQKVPKPKRLQDWYKKMLDKGKNDGIVVKYNNIVQQTEEDKSTSAADLPHFEGDLMPKLLEQSNTSKSNHNDDTKWRDTFCKKMQKHKNSFFVARLHPAASVAKLPPIQDQDPLNKCDFMDDRDTFASFLREHYYQFSTKQHAEYSTLCILYDLHNKDVFVYNCDNCKKSIETRYHCTECGDFDLCAMCKDKITHEHTLKKCSSDSDTQKRSISSIIEDVQHACECKVEQCNRKNCKKMKDVVAHSSICKKKSTGECSTCKQFIALCCYHAKQCFEVKCQMPNCQRIKDQIVKQQLVQRMKHEETMQRHVTFMMADEKESESSQEEEKSS